MPNAKKFVRLMLILMTPFWWACTAKPIEEEEEDEPAPPPDVCNSMDEALSLPDCLMVFGTEKTGYIGAAGDFDYFLVQMPSTLTPRSLFRLSGGYAAENTAVNLSVNVLT